ncbi:hypothetical protein [Erythrobacter sp. MTPC3]|uniref:hypothetical protein n=1 Tax=Erythrobacter sp. MTPC3 TaxID=3056564 RepID=UPI0036F3880E
MAHITLRMSDEATAIVDDLAKAAGMTRSAWINRAIRDAMPRRPDEIRDVPTGPIQKTSRVGINLPISEIEAIDRVANQAGLSRHEWLKRTVRWQLWARAGELRLVPASVDALHEIANQIRKIGNSLNQAVKAMNAANKPGAPLEICQTAKHVLVMRDDLAERIDGAARQAVNAARGEVQYWRQAEELWSGEGENAP